MPCTCILSLTSLRLYYHYRAKGELGFFDFYIIFLAKELNECGVFGVSGDEFLNYAKANRAEWEQKGEAIVAGMLKKLEEPDVTY